MDLLKEIKKIRDRGIFIKVNVGRKPFDPSTQKRTTAFEDIIKKKRRNKRKKLVLLVVALMLVGSVAMAQSPITIPSELSAKQGMVMTFKGQLQNTTTVEMIKTREIVGAPKLVNALWTGLSIDGGFAYDADSADNAVIVLSRHINNWADYLPLIVPDAIKAFDISANIGVEARDFTTNVNWTGVGGFSYLKASIKF